MKKLTRALFALFVSACASVPKASHENDQEAKKFQPLPDKSVIYIYRDEAFGGAVRMDILIDGFLLGEMRSKSYMRAIVKPGSHIVTSRSENSSQLPVTTEAGKIYYVWQEAKMGFMYARTELHLVENDVGQKGVMSCELVQHNQMP